MKRLALGALVVLIALAGLWQASSLRSFQMFGEHLSRVATDKPMVALTFDDGPSAQYTQDVIDILASRAVVATFFVTGHEAAKNPEQMKALVAAGHEIGNHSYTHRRMLFMSPGTIRKELADTDAAIRAAGYQGTIHFRPPYGKRLLVLPWILAQQNRLTIMWEGEPDADPKTDATTLVSATVEGAKPGDIILLHPMYSTRGNTRAALAPIIDGLRAKGFELVTVGELLAAGR